MKTGTNTAYVFQESEYSNDKEIKKVKETYKIKYKIFLKVEK